MVTTVPASAPYAAVLTLLFLVLSARVIARRRGGRVAIGTGGDPALKRVARVHANVAEYVPLALLLMFLVEASGYPPWLVPAAGALLVAGRLVHAWGVSQEKEDFRLRMAGMVITPTLLGALVLLLLIAVVFLNLQAQD